MRHWIIASLLAVLSLSAQAETTPQAAADLYQTECGSCHIAFPARLLPADSWQRLMADLTHHFGTDASLSKTEVRAISQYLLDHAGRRAVDPDSPIRITKSPWFVHEHDETRSAVWSRPAIKTPANCQACHLKAAQGSYRERDIRVPR